MATTIQIPDFNFSAFFYADILDALIAFKRVNVPELTDESEFEPYIQLLRAFALVGHLNNVNTDVVANESTLVTAQLVEQVRNMLRLIDYELAPATPAQVDILYELSRVITTTTEVVSEGARCATAGATPINFEANNAISIDATNVLDQVWGVDGGVYTDHTIDANSPVTPADDWSPWLTPAVGDALYFGHADILWDQLDFTFTSGMSGISGFWEYYDGNFNKAAPDTVVQVDDQLQVGLNGYLGAVNKSGTQIRVRLNSTGAFEDATVVWTGSVNRVIIGLLGQSDPSEDPEDYIVGSDWEEIRSIEDETEGFTVDGAISFPVPQQIDQNWIGVAVNGVTAKYIRFRITAVTVPVSPVIQQARLDRGRQYVIGLATQGTAQADSPLGSSTGLPGQRFTLSQPNFIHGSEQVDVDGETWTRVTTFLNSGPTDEHYVVELIENDTGVIAFGDGILGRIPPIGVGNIITTYRNNAHENGNVGASSITVDKTGLTFVERLSNPRQAAGWAEAQGASESSLERAKILGPQSLRDKDVAVGTSGLITLTQTFQDENGSKPFSRAAAFEEGFGEKTVELVVVAKGGAQASTEQLDALELYFNGDKFATPPVPSHFVANQQVIATNHQQNVINVTAIVTGNVTPEEIRNRLAAVIQPEALKDDGVTWEWDFGGEVPYSRISHEIFETDESIKKVDMIQPVADIQLTPRQLPKLGTVTITVIPP